MKLFIYAFLIAVLFAFSVSAQTPTKTETPKQETQSKAEAVLRVEVENGKSVILNEKDLAKHTRREVKAKAHDEKEAIYSGYNLSDILLDAGAKLGKGELRGKQLAAYLLVEAADDYRAIFSITELSTDFTDRSCLPTRATANRSTANKALGKSSCRTTKNTDTGYVRWSR